MTDQMFMRLVCGIGMLSAGGVLLDYCGRAVKNGWPMGSFTRSYGNLAAVGSLIYAAIFLLYNCGLDYAILAGVVSLIIYFIPIIPKFKAGTQTI